MLGQVILLPPPAVVYTWPVADAAAKLLYSATGGPKSGVSSWELVQLDGRLTEKIANEL